MTQEKAHRYESIEPIEREEADAILREDDATRKPSTLIRMGWYGEARWVVDTCVPLLLASHPDISNCAALALLYVAQREPSFRPELREQAIRAMARSHELQEGVLDTLSELHEIAGR